MGDIIAQLGVGGIFALLTIKTVLDFLKNKKNGKNSKNSDYSIQFFTHIQEQKVAFKIIEAMNENIKWLKEIHDVKDEDGVPVWYVRSSLEGAIVKLANNIEAQTKVFEAMVIEFRHQKKDN